MARIRTIKPEFWSSPSLDGTSMECRLTYIALWNWADDHGRGTCEPRELHGFVFPRDDELTLAHFRRVLEETRRAFGVVFYEFRGRHFYSIPAWDKHQKIDRRSEAKHPDPEEGKWWSPSGEVPFDQGFSQPPEPSAEIIEPSGEPSEPSTLEIGTGNREIGNRNREIGTSHAATESAFNTAYDHWPKKVERKLALDKFRAASRTVGVDQLAGYIVKFGDAYAATTERQFTPALNVWLGHERWTDELPSSPVTTRRPTRTDQNVDFVAQLRLEESQKEIAQ